MATLRPLHNAYLCLSRQSSAGNASERGGNRAEATGTFSATTTIAALVTFLLGTYALLGDVRVAAAAAVATTGILIVREALHDWVAKDHLGRVRVWLGGVGDDLHRAAMLPDRTVGPLGGLNVRAVWLIAIVLALVSFAGYVSVKLLGERRGSLLGAAMGGLVSSTAVTLANARRVAAGEGSPRILRAAPWSQQRFLSSEWRQSFRPCSRR